MREYETLFIIQPEISDEGASAILAKIDGALEKGGASRLLCEDMGKRKLAYEIEKFHKGHYHVLRYLDEGAVVPDVERVLRLEESVLRFMTVLVEEQVEDVEARRAAAKEEEADQQRRAEERAAREAEEAKAREEAERYKAEQAAAEQAAAEQAAAEQARAEAAEASEEGSADESGDDTSEDDSGDDESSDDDENEENE